MADTISTDALLLEMEILGLLEITEDDYIGLTDKGQERAVEILGTMTEEQQMLVLLHCEYITRDMAPRE